MLDILQSGEPVRPGAMEDRPAARKDACSVRHSFVVRIWREVSVSGWRGWVQYACTGEAVFVRELPELLAFIEQRTGALALPSRRAQRQAARIPEKAQEGAFSRYQERRGGKVNRKSEALLWSGQKGESLAHLRIAMLVLGLAALVLAMVAVVAGMGAIEPGVPVAAAVTVDASSARWSALGKHYAPDYEAIAAVNSARWNALGEWYAAKSVQGQ